MKILKSLILLSLSFFISINTYSSHLSGATIWYKSIGNNKYDVYLEFYRDCRGIPFSSPTFIIKNVKTGATANSTPTNTAVMEITNLCKTASKGCNPPNTTSGAGYEKHVYKATIDLTTWKNAGACQVLIGAGQCCRNGDITTGGSANNFFVWSMIDLCKGSGNNSAIFGDEPKQSLSCNSGVKINYAASDYTDNDSLAYDLVDPMQDWTNKTPWNTGFNSQNPFSVYWPTTYDKSKGPNPNANPPVGFYFNRQSGEMIFTPMNCSESTILSLRVSEYRKDSTGKYNLIGYITRDFQTTIKSGVSNNIPTISASDNIYMSDNVKSCFTVSTSDKAFVLPPPQKQIDNDTTTLSMFFFTPKKNTSVSFTIIDTKAKLKSAQVCWEPKGLASNTPYQMVFKVMDNACSLYGFGYKTVNIYVQKSTNLAWIEGLTYFDKNKNCTLDSNESMLPNQKIIFGSGSQLESDSTGNFARAIEAGNYTFKILNKYGAFVCSKSINIVKGNSYKFNMGAAPMMHISGTFYKDTSKNCKFETSEPIWPNQMVYTEPGNYITSTDGSGKYDFKIPAGDYKIKYKPAGANYFTKCALPFVTINYDTLITNQNIAIYDSSNIIDLTSKISTVFTFKRGGNQGITVTVKNNGSKTVNGTLWFKYNKKLKFDSASSYVSKTDSNIRWDFTNLSAGNELRFYMVLYADASTCQLNDTMTLQSWLDTTGISKDVNWSNNYDNHKIKITGKTNPNLKQEILTNGYSWREGNKLRYCIQFRNTGKKTVNTIWIIDTLSFPISGSSLQMLGASHANTYTINNNVLKVNFTGINLPDSTTDKIKSFGYFEFSAEIDPKTNREIKFYNRADIYFDTVIAAKTNKFYTTYTSYINTGKTNEISYCLSDTLKVSYSSKFQFGSGNTFKLILSNSDGVFDNTSKVLDSLASTATSGTFKTKLSSSIAGGSNYKTKVISTNPYSMELADGVSNSFKIFTNIYKPIIKVKDTLICGKDSILISISTLLDSLYIYDRNTLLAKVGNIPDLKLKISPGKHYITARRLVSSSCSISSDTLIFNNDTIPNIELKCTSHSNTYGCLGDTVTLKATNAYVYRFYDKTYNLLEQNNTGNYSKLFDYGLNEIWVVGKSKYGCSDTSKLFTIDMLDGLPPDIQFSDADQSLCKGLPVTITGSGSYIKYQLYRNNKSWLDTFVTTIVTKDIEDKDSIKLKGTTIYGCTSFSQSFGFKIYPLPKVSMTCIDTDLTLCDGVNNNGTTFNFAGASIYRIFKNKILLGYGSGNMYLEYNVKDKDTYYTEGISVEGCKDTSNIIKLAVRKALITMNVNKGGPVCDGDSIRFDFTGGLSYQLFKNKKLWQTINKQFFTIRNMTQIDTVYARGTDSFGCIANSSNYGFNIFKSPIIKISNFNRPNNSSCEGEDVVINIIGVAKHDLYKNGTLWKAGLGTSTTFNDEIDKDEIYATGIGPNGCKGFSNIIIFTVWPIPSKPIITKIGNDLFSSYSIGNQWYDNTSQILGAINQKYTPTKFSDYFVKHTSVNGCLSPISDKFSFTTGIEKLNLIGLKIYPNPATDHITIETGEAGHYQIKLIDITGKLLKQDSFIGKQFEMNFKVQKGIYQLVISNEKGQIKTLTLEVN